MTSNNRAKRGTTYGVLSVALFTLGSIFIYLAFESGLVSLVSPITNGYPILMVVIAHSFLKEKLTINQKSAIILFILGTIEAVSQLVLAQKIFLLFRFRALSAFLIRPVLNCWTASILVGVT